ncbi:UNKNOWN [Stylonychia lemnae]|uniref:Cilia- and flagella-associated protein 300 n=1 Tax=Stylonychia lemnae TaxID=5949 RepID=A0A078ATI1_STYLE|nr:UNKNOWN [Stylonychia lemnae]|eukprot:CDW85539.1 UNKNOWN [Stylonychia lemnae]
MEISQSRDLEDDNQNHGYSFIQLADDAKLFSNFKRKETQEKFFQWGLTEKNLKFAKYRFNQTFHLVGADNFLRDLCNDKTIQSTFEPLSYLAGCTGVKYKKLNSEVINMSFFDFLVEKDIATADGYIRKELEELYEGISLGDRMRKALLWEESEYFMELQEDKIQNEFIFKLFQMISIGGSICQYEENLKEYLDLIKNLYKDLITVAKDQDSGEIKIYSHVFLVEAVEGLESLFPVKDHPQNFFFVIVDPIHWHVTLLYHKWSNYW